MTIGTDTLAQDTFNRSNGNLNGSTMSDGVNTWTAFNGTPTVASNALSGTGLARVTANTGFGNANYSVQAVEYMKGDVSFAYDGVSGSLVLIGRYVDANNYYIAWISCFGAGNETLDYRIGKVVSGTYSNLVTSGEDDGSGTTWRFDLDGTSLKLFKDGSQVLSTTDSTFTGVGYAGVSASSYNGVATPPVATTPAYSADSFIVKGTAAGGGNVEVEAEVDALTLTEYAAGVSLDVNISTSVDSLTLTEYAADVDLDVIVAALVDSLTLTTYDATVEVGGNTDVDANTANLTLTEYPASVNNIIYINAATDSLSLTENAASVQLNVSVAASFDSLTLTENVAFIEYPVFVSALYDSLTLTTYGATVFTGSSTLTNPGATSITYNGWTATVDVNL